jgi:lipid-A-disaccharide synthase
MKYYIIAGEASGDLHGSNLIKELLILDPHAEINAWGGDLMQNAGAKIVKHYRDLAFMGFTEVVMNLGTILKNIKFCKQNIIEFQPDCIILIDYPGFNLRIAQFAKKNNIKVIYYISPQIWAWKESRIHIIKKCVDEMLVILPFEKEFYAKHNMPVHFVGHPLIDAISSFKLDKEFLIKNHLSDKPIVALLPGSRKQEISKILPIMLESINDIEDIQIVIAAAPSVEIQFYKELITNKNITIVQNDTYNILSYAKAALVTSGTATLETALFEVPQIVCYKGGQISYWLAKQLIKVKYISLVNLIMDKPVVKEMIQDKCNAIEINTELKQILFNKELIVELKKQMLILKETLGGSEASKKAARIIHSSS